MRMHLHVWNLNRQVGILLHEHLCFSSLRSCPFMAGVLRLALPLPLLQQDSQEGKSTHGRTSERTRKRGGQKKEKKKENRLAGETRVAFLMGR